MAKLRYFTYNSPIGDIYVVSTEKGICRVDFKTSENELVQRLERKFRKDVIKDPNFFNSLITKLDRYFSGKPTRFTFPINFIEGTDFQKRVWRALLEIPFGEVRSYKQIAQQVGNPNAYRAVGSAVGKNPINFIIPCHRVIRSDGKLGGYGLGIDLKKKLLQMEGHSIP